jgi:PPP family 3-phenylpropionic acid transporter
VVSTRVVGLIGPLGLIAVGGVVAIIRWGLLATDPGFFGVFGLQMLHAFTFAATYLGNQHAIARLVPEEMTASAQSIYASSNAILTAAATAASGPLYEAFGAEAFLAMTAPAAAALVIVALFAWLSPKAHGVRA